MQRKCSTTDFYATKIDNKLAKKIDKLSQACRDVACEVKTLLDCADDEFCFSLLHSEAKTNNKSLSARLHNAAIYLQRELDAREAHRDKLAKLDETQVKSEIEKLQKLLEAKRQTTATE